MKIPTARDISRDSTRSGRIANSGPVSNVGAAMAGFGQDLVQSAFNLKDLADKEVQELSNKRGNDVSTALTNFLNSEEEGFLKARDSSTESGIGFTRQYIEGYQKRADDFAKQNFAGLSDDDQTKYNNTLLGRGNSLYEKAYDYETKAKTLYYDRNTNSSLDNVRKLIRNSAAPFDQLKVQGLEAINSADMPETWKAIRRQEWEADAAESKWRWKFQNAPQQALDEIRGTGGTDAVLMAMQDVESSGDPNAESPKGASGLMQVMPETGAEIAGELRDGAFPTNGTVEEQKAYLKNADVSKKYGEHFYKKMLARYSGDKEAALIAYNGGQTRADAWIAAGRDDSVIPKESADYYKKVLGKAKVSTFTSQDVSQAKVFLQSRTDKDATHIDGLDDGFSVKLARMFQSAPPEIQAGLGIYSGARSNERQAELWKEALAKYGSIDEARRNVAPPGHSNHNAKDGQKARAADVAFNGQSLKNAPANVVKWVHENAPQYGLKFPLANENWHIEDASTRGGKAAPVDPDLDAIPYDRREQLANWGETEYSQQRTLERTRVKDSYNLLIASKPEEVDANVILRDNTIDDGDKAALINSLRTAMKDTGQVNGFIRSLAGGGASVNPFDPDETKVADKAYEKMVAAAPEDQQAVVASGFVAGTKYIPKQVQADLRRGAASTDVASMGQAMAAANVLQKNAPIAFGAFPGGEAVRKNLDLFRTYTNDLGFTPEEAARRLIDSNDPDKVRAREALLDSKPIKKLIDGIDADTVASEFSKGWFSPSVGGLATPEQIKVGVNSEAEAVLVEDYREAFREALVDTNGNEAAAKEEAKKRFAKRHGPSQFTVLGSNVIIRNPPEAVYPAAPDGTHNYIREQAIEGIKGMGVPAVDNVYLQPDNETEKDIRAGRPPRYRVFFETDAGLQLAPYYFQPDPAAPEAKAKEEAAKQIKDAETRMIERRTQDLNEQQAVDRALADPVGTDWMKARAAETAVEKQRMDKAFGGPIMRESPSTNDKAGGGGGY